MNVSSAYNIHRLGLRGVLPPGTGHGSHYWRCPGFCLCGHCEWRATFSRTPEVFELPTGSCSRDRWHCQLGVCSGPLPPLSVSLPFCPFLHAHCFGSHWVPSIVEAEIWLCGSHWSARGLLYAACLPSPEAGTVNFPGVSCFPHFPFFFFLTSQYYSFFLVIARKHSLVLYACIHPLMQPLIHVSNSSMHPSIHAHLHLTSTCRAFI